jgi:hypothetical protein
MNNQYVEYIYIYIYIKVIMEIVQQTHRCKKLSIDRSKVYYGGQ